MKNRLFILIATLFLIAGLPPAIALAQNSNTSERATTGQTFVTQMRATDINAGISGKTNIILWGISPTGSSNSTLLVRARNFMDKAMGARNIECTLKNRTASALISQCFNDAGTDLGLLMLQNGYAIVDRASVYGTQFEKPYLEAEKTAQDSKTGIWADNNQINGGTTGNLLIILGFILFIIIIIAFTTLTLIIMRGFQKVTDAQNRNADIATRERALKDKEREIFAGMLDAEIKANKSKIEAYLIVYDEMLKSLKDQNKQPKYQSVGDIVQTQPALSRSIFDRNTEKLDVLGNQLSSDVVHFYARIKTNAEYTNIEPNMPLDEVINIVEKIITGAKRLNTIADRIIDSFAEVGLSSHNHN